MKHKTLARYDRQGLEQLWWIEQSSQRYRIWSGMRGKTRSRKWTKTNSADTATKQIERAYRRKMATGYSWENPQNTPCSEVPDNRRKALNRPDRPDSWDIAHSLKNESWCGY